MKTIKKTVRDAVIYFKAEWRECPSISIGQHSHRNTIVWECIGGEGTGYYVGQIVVGMDSYCINAYKKICNQSQFNTEVDLLASNMGRATQSYAEYKALYNSVMGDKKDSKMNTIEHKGKVYQVGCFYEFKDETGSYWEVGVLCDYEDGKFKSKCGNKQEWYDSIMRCTGVMGTVVDAPITLIDGKAYQFEHNGIVWNGIYIKGENSMWYSLRTAKVSDCTNIQPLTVEVK